MAKSTNAGQSSYRLIRSGPNRPPDASWTSAIDSSRTRAARPPWLASFMWSCSFCEMTAEIGEQRCRLLSVRCRAVEVEVGSLQCGHRVVLVEPAGKQWVGIGQRDSTAADRLEPAALVTTDALDVGGDGRRDASRCRTRSSNGRPSFQPWTNCVPACGAVGWMKPDVRSGSPGAGAGSSPDAGGHRLVPGRGLGRIGHTDHLAELHGELDRGPRARQPLGLVAVEQRVARPAGNHQIELPRQVGGVTEARAHALTRKRAA